ncbi:LOW QUALITY PROTEIN: AAA ATPase-like protein [Burkholderiales bacterium 23]|nr:LOW QUALITY PROTEIN: AAA ATPase-like protein [Burkholderiales bacterium 23]
MKISYSIENLRSLTTAPKIELRPITILVGRNSAGKSTFLRSFALLRQSLEAKSSAPILWYGDYVDFGDFSSAVNHASNSKEITFNFSAEKFSVSNRYQNYPLYYDDLIKVNSGRKSQEYSSINLSISLGEQMGRTVRRTVRLTDPSYGISFVASFAKDGRNADSFVVNDAELSVLLPNHSVIFTSSDIFSAGTLVTTVKADSRQLRRIVNPAAAFASYIAGLVANFVDGRILPPKIEAEARRILQYPNLSPEALTILASTAPAVSFRKLYDSLLRDDYKKLYKEINVACAMNYVLQAISDAGGFLERFFSQTTYLGPARARSERYYRFQELEISEIAPDGHNLPMFLGSLPPVQLRQFSEWVSGLFGFGVGVQRTEGHISIQLKRDGLDVNAADTGYGVSQLLPVLAQIWWSSKTGARERRNSLYPITMEQPELHLHPAHQAQLADALLNALPNTQDDTRGSPVFVVETHSETLINRLGELIEEGKLRAEDVQIVIFSSEDGNLNSTRIETSNYDAEGVLENWPFGFFSY